MLIVLGILAMDATGLDALVASEQCASVQDERPDGSCPALCVRCACCAQPIVPAIARVIVSVTLPQPLFEMSSQTLPRVAPSEIFHVPKLASTI
jgi:hypothetical protein